MRFKRLNLAPMSAEKAFKRYVQKIACYDTDTTLPRMVILNAFWICWKDFRDEWDSVWSLIAPSLDFSAIVGIHDLY